MPRHQQRPARPAEPGHQAAGQRGRGHVDRDQIVGETEEDHPEQAGDGQLEPPVATLLHSQDAERDHRGQRPGGAQRHVEQQVEAERRADELGQVGGHRDQLGLHPQAHGTPPAATAPGTVRAGRGRWPRRSWPTGTGPAWPSGWRPRRPRPARSRTARPRRSWWRSYPGRRRRPRPRRPARAGPLRRGAARASAAAAASAALAAGGASPAAPQVRPGRAGAVRGLLPWAGSAHRPTGRGRATAACWNPATAGSGPRRAGRTRSSAPGCHPTGVCSSATSVLVVSSRPATDAPFCSADRATRSGSMMPMSIMLP